MTHKKFFPNQQTLRFILALIAFFASLVYTFLSLFSYSFTAGSLPAFVRIPRMSPVFADLRQLTHQSACDASFADLLANTANCDPWQRPFNYTFPALHTFRTLGFDASSTEFLGTAIGIFGLATALMFIFLLVKGRVIKLLISTAFLMSFPFQLALERGNYDLAVFGACLLVPALLFTPNVLRCQTIKAITASALSFASVALKVFPAVGLVPWSLWLAFRWPKNRSKWVPALILFISCLGLFIQRDLFQIMANTPKPEGVMSFGLLATSQADLGNMLALFLIAFKLVFVVIMMYILRFEQFDGLFGDKQFDSRTESSKQAALLFSCMIVIIWLISRSWDYRLIFLLGVVPHFANAFNNFKPSIRIPKIIICLITLFLMYEEYGPRYTFPDQMFYVSLFSETLLHPILIAFLISFLLRNRKSNIILK